jgi:hypothetical protein
MGSSMNAINLDALPASTLLSRNDTASVLNVSGASIRRYERALELKCVKLSERVVRYRVGDIREFIARSRMADAALA